MKRLLFAAFCLLAMSPASFGQAPPPESMSVQDILEKALEQADQAQAMKPQERFRMRVRRVSEELNARGQVKSREETVHEVLPAAGHWFEKLVQRNGKPLSSREASREDDRLRRFEARVRAGKKPDSQAQGVSFDRNLVDKYIWAKQPAHAWEGRPCYVLSFRPKGRNLPVRSRLDYALNKAEGSIWIDIQSFEVARVSFQLKERIRLWWGLLGSITQADGSVERKPVGDGVWLPSRFELVLDGRILFSSLHRRQRIDWSDFAGVSEDAN